MGVFLDISEEKEKEHSIMKCDFHECTFHALIGAYKPEGTYMLLLDCEEWCKTHGMTILELEKVCWDVGVACQDGQMFHVPYGLRVNLALPLSRVQKAFDRMDKYVFNAE